MTTAELANYIAPFLAPAKRIVDALPTKHTVTDFTSPATAAKLEGFERRLARPSTRTYYLGANGRVSQRPKLVGEIVAMVRATTTLQAQIKFNDEILHGACYSKLVLAPTHIGKPKPVLDSRGRVIPSCWLSLTCEDVQTAPETLAERGVICDRASYTTEVVR